MKVIKTKEGHYECPRGHRSDQCVELRGYGGRPDGIYCLPCLTLAIIDRLAVPKVELVVPAPRPEPVEPEPAQTEPEPAQTEPAQTEPEPAQTEPEEGAEGHPTETEPGAELTGDPGVEVPPPNKPEEGEEDEGGEHGVPEEPGGEPAAD